MFVLVGVLVGVPINGKAALLGGLLADVSHVDVRNLILEHVKFGKDSLFPHFFRHSQPT